MKNGSDDLSRFLANFFTIRQINLSGIDTLYCFAQQTYRRLECIRVVSREYTVIKDLFVF